MKHLIASAAINASMWLSVGAAITIAVMQTGRISALWFFFIPATFQLSTTVTTITKTKGRTADDE